MQSIYQHVCHNFLPAPPCCNMQSRCMPYLHRLQPRLLCYLLLLHALLLQIAHNYFLFKSCTLSI